MWPSAIFSGLSLNVTVGVNDAFQHTHTQGDVDMADNSELAEAEDGEGLLVLVNWIGICEDEHTWRNAPDFIKINHHRKCAQGARVRSRCLRQCRNLL